MDIELSVQIERQPDYTTCGPMALHAVLSFSIADPLLANPAHGTKYYRANVYRLLDAILSGVGRDDGNLLVIRPKGWKKKDQTLKTAQRSQTVNMSRTGKAAKARKGAKS